MDGWKLIVANEQKEVYPTSPPTIITITKTASHTGKCLCWLCPCKTQLLYQGLKLPTREEMHHPFFLSINCSSQFPGSCFSDWGPEEDKPTQTKSRGVDNSESSKDGWGPRNQTLSHHDKPQIPRHSPVQLSCWLDGILSLNYYSVLYLQPQSLASKVLSNVWEVSCIQVYPLTVWLTGTICKRSTLPVTSIYLQLYHKCFSNLCLSIIWHMKRTFALGPSSCEGKWWCVNVTFIRHSHT